MRCLFRSRAFWIVLFDSVAVSAYKANVTLCCEYLFQ
jgi:hypothetical protein